MTVLLTTARNRLLAWGRWSVLLCLFFVPINKPLTSIFIFLALLCTLTGGRIKERLLAACRQPVVIGTCFWFFILTLSALHAPDHTERWAALSTYKAFLYPLIIASLLETQRWRNRGLLAFALATGLVLLLSWAQFLGIVPIRDVAQQFDAYRYTVFKDYTQQGIALLVLATMAASFAQTTVEVLYKRLLWLISALAFSNVVFLLQSRTAYLIVVPLLFYWVWHLINRHGPRSHWRSIALGLFTLGVVGSLALLTPRMQERMRQAKQDLSLYAQKRQATSLGIRLELWKRTLPIIATASMFGHGLGQWRVQYAIQTAELPDFSAFRMGHPHQEALYILSEQGIVGCAIFALLLVALARHIRQLERPHRDFYTCLLLIYVMAGLVNCVLADFSHRHVFLTLLACIPIIDKRQVDCVAANI